MKIRITESQLRKCVDKAINEISYDKLDIEEQGFGDYPAGAENDPRAPWNIDDEEDEVVEDIEVIDEDDVYDFDNIYVQFISNFGNKSEYTLREILEGTKVSEGMLEYFNEKIKQQPRDEKWIDKIKLIATMFERTNFIEFKNEIFETYKITKNNLIKLIKGH
jgi:hypothetical protein